MRFIKIVSLFLMASLALAACNTSDDRSKDESKGKGEEETQEISLPEPSLPDVSLPTPSLPTPSLPTPSLPTPSLPTPSLPTPSLPTPSLPTPSLPTPSLPTPSLPTPSLPNVSITTEDDQIKMEIPDTVLFDFDKSELKPEAKETLDAIAKVFLDYKGADVQINGHTDNIGSDRYNMALSEKRAEAVRKYLEEKKALEHVTVLTRGYGETKPAVPNDSEKNRQKNRRVEIIIKPKKS